MAMNSKEIYNILRNGSSDDRVHFLKSAPKNSFKTDFLPLIASDDLGMVVTSLVAIVQKYCQGEDLVFGIALAKATHALALEIYKSDLDPRDLVYPTTLTNLASSCVGALDQLGRSQEILDFLGKYLPYYESLGEKDAILYRAEAEAHFNLNRIDKAETLLMAIDSSRSPGAKIGISSLLKKIADIKHPPTETEPPSPPIPVGENPDIINAVIDGLDSLGMQGAEKIFKKRLKEGCYPPLDRNDPEQVKEFLDLQKLILDSRTKGTEVDWLEVEKIIARYRT